MRGSSLLLSLTASLICQAQPSIQPDTIEHKKHLAAVATTQLVGYGGTLIALDQTWYSQYPKSKLHAYNDWGEWKQLDKIGHVYGCYIQGKTSMELYRWAGLSRKKQIWIGGLTGTAFQTLIEYMDGRSAEWGWSWGDVAANLTGSALLIGQELAWNEQRIHLKFSFHPTRYSDPELQSRSEELYGSSWTTRMLKDYNAQTYWASFRLRSFFPKSRIPDWLCLSIGTGADGLWGGYNNWKTDENGFVVFDRSDIARSRQWYLAPDIDFTRIPTKKKWMRVVLFTLNAFKLPSPALEYKSGRWKLHGLYF